MKRVLKPAELAYRGVNRIRRHLYRSGVLGHQKLDKPVISIGNLAIGGSGKTPVAIETARALVERGHKLAVLTRGYGRTSPREIELVTSRDAERFGDEAVLIADSLPGTPVVVGSDRFAAATWFLKQGDCEAFLLDDAFQHLQLARDVNIVIDDAGATFLREGPAALRDADIVLMRAHDVPRSSLPSFVINLVPFAVRIGNVRQPVTTLHGRRVFAFSGIAHNGRFFHLLESLDAVLAGHRAFGDHHRYSATEIAAIRNDAASRGAELVITTAKDAVKIADPSIAVLEVEMRIDRLDEYVAIIEQRLS